MLFSGMDGYDNCPLMAEGICSGRVRLKAKQKESRNTAHYKDIK